MLSYENQNASVPDETNVRFIAFTRHELFALFHRYLYCLNFRTGKHAKAFIHRPLYSENIRTATFFILSVSKRKIISFQTLDGKPFYLLLIAF